MAAPVSYTEKTLADFMHAELGKTGSLLAYAVGAADAGSYQEAVNETLLNYGASTVDGAVDIQKLRALARVEAWRKAVGDLTTAYRFTSEGSTFDRGRLYQQAVETLLRRLNGVVIARQYVLVDYDVETELLARACALTPGIESPTISPLQKAGWSAVRAMVPHREINRIMDELWSIGARGILVTDIHACRL